MSSFTCAKCARHLPHAQQDRRYKATPGVALCRPCARRRRRDRKAARRRRTNLRGLILRAYGGRCSCPGCEASDPRVLQLNHKRGGGARERQRHRNIYRAVRDVYERTGRWPRGYNLKCANCNWAAGRSGRCPIHEEKE
jgi:hypothetical protein